MKTILSILIAAMSYFMASAPAQDCTYAVRNPYDIYEYSMQQYICSNQIHSDAVESSNSVSLQLSCVPKHTYSHKHCTKEDITKNRCGVHLGSVSLLHNSLPAITTLHHHILVLGRLII